MQATFRLFPWDVEADQDAASRLRADGVERVALAATYHGARTITPRHPRHRIVDLPESASYLREPTPLPRGAFSFEDARGDLERAGIRVDTWAVIGHVDGVLADLPRVRNAFGDRIEHAPCLSHESVRTALRKVAAAAGRAAAGATLHLEAVGWQRLAHASLHDKLHGADLTEDVEELLSVCACETCAAAANVDPALLATVVRAAVDGDPCREDDVLHALRAARADTADRFALDLIEVASAAGAERVGLAADETPGEARDQVELLVDCWGTTARALDLLAIAGGGTAYVDALTGDPREFAARWQELADAGATALHVYHAGIASTTRRRAAADAAVRCRALAEPADPAAALRLDDAMTAAAPTSTHDRFPWRT